MAKKIITIKVLLKPIMFMMHVCGCHPKRDDHIIKKIIPAVFTFLNIFWTIFMVINITHNDDPVINCISYIGISQVAVKTIQLHLHREDYGRMIDVLYDKFWDPNEIPDQTKIYDKLHKIMNITIKVYSVIIWFCIMYVFVRPLSRPTKTLPLNIWFFDNQKLYETPYFELTWTLQYISAVFCTLFAFLPYDLLFIVFVGCSYIQFEMLKQKLRDISKGIREHDEDQAFQRLKQVVKHHNLILDFLNDVELYYSRINLKQFLDSVICIGAIIYLQEQNFKLIYVVPLITNFLQSLLYSLFGQTIQDQSLEVANAAYDSGWESLRDKKVKQGLALIIQRSHRQVKITAGGVIDLSFETFADILKTAFSFVAVLRSTNWKEK